MGIIPLLIFTSLLSILNEFCEYGPRAPSTAAHRKARDYIIRRLGSAGIDSFTYQNINFYNIIAAFNKTDIRRIGIATHWDSRPTADCEKEIKKRLMPIIGANDGGSGVAVLLALSDSLRRRPPPRGVDLIFFDGEDFGPEPQLLGSKYFARHCDRPYEFIILIDMIGDKDLRIYREGYSNKFFPDLVDSIWHIGKELNRRVFRDDVKYFVIDDHIPLIEHGIRAINIIDFDYAHWHTLEDTPDKCSEASLSLILKILLKICYEQY